MRDRVTSQAPCSMFTVTMSVCAVVDLARDSEAVFTDQSAAVSDAGASVTMSILSSWSR